MHSSNGFGWLVGWLDFHQ